jgi:NAD(P)-dependent dehydrogenase (short-subunit alcohol dehydrogenase family)
VADYELEDWRRVLAVNNLDGTFYSMRAELRAMRATGSGSIANVGSIFGAAGAPLAARLHRREARRRRHGGASTAMPTGTATGTTTWVGTAVGIAPELAPDKVKALRTKVAALAAAGLFVAEKLDLLEGLISLVERFTE